jgi:hypothetical protein
VRPAPRELEQDPEPPGVGRRASDPSETSVTGAFALMRSVSIRARRAGLPASRVSGSAHGPSTTRPRRSSDPTVLWMRSSPATAIPSTSVPSGNRMHNVSVAASYSAASSDSHGVAEVRKRWPSLSTTTKRRLPATPSRPSSTRSG